MIGTIIRHFFFIAAVTLILLFTSGCWNNRDITDLAIAVGVGLDKTEEGKIQLTIQIVNPHSAPSSQQEGGNPLESGIQITVLGDTVFDAARNIITKSNKKLYFSHIQVIVIGETLARDSIGEIIDFFERDHETRRKVDVVIAKGATAKEILNTKSQLESLTSVHLSESLKNAKALGKSQVITLFDILQQVQAPGKDIVIGNIGFSGSSTEKTLEHMEMQGSSIFKKGQLVGFLSPEETRGYLFGSNQIKSTILVLPNPLEKGKQLSIEVIGSTGKTHARVEDGKPLLTIQVEAVGNIGEVVGNSDVTTFEMGQLLENLAAKHIQKEIEQVLDIIQKKYQSDIFGFQTVIYQKQYGEWLEITPLWEELYKEASVSVDVSFRLKGFGLIQKSVEIQ